MSTEILIDEQDQENWNVVLDDLRESGIINMFGAPSWLQDNFCVSKKESQQIFNNWTETYNR
jgi:hypothetical protein|tara:strand:- start:1383 stop:1568 length:186 start_codon:yes stop_codon:yes gene_type:complete